MSAASGSDGAAVVLRDVTKIFGAKRAVDGVSLRVARGSVLGLIGPNGAGKTTTFSMMAGYLRPTQGDVQVLGFDPWKAPELRGRLGVLPQDAMLPANEAVGRFLVHLGRLQGIAASEVEAQARAVLNEVGGGEWWGLRCGALSHGMAKRVALAQALLGSPEVVLLDEPTAGLDPRVAYDVRNVLRGRRGKTTLIVSSHNLQELQEICDAAAILDHGKLVTAGSIGELTGASEEVHIGVAPARGSASGVADVSVLLTRVQAIPIVKRADWATDRQELIVYFERSDRVDAEEVIGETLRVLLELGARIRAVGRGRSLEQRVIEVTALP